MFSYSDECRTKKAFKYFERVLLLFRVVVKLLLNVEGVTISKNQRIIFKSLSMSYFIIRQSKREGEKLTFYR